MTRKRGRQNKHWAEQARAWAWYREIKQRCDWSDYQLDDMFAWTEEGEASRSSDHRPRTFEWIRKTARKPAGLDKRWRDMDALVSAVERHSWFQGTQVLYQAELWELLQMQSMTPENVQMRIDRIFIANGLVRIDPFKVSPIADMVAKYQAKPVFDRCLRLSLSRMDGLSGIALVWLLYLQTEPPHNWPFRETVESIADTLLDQFFEHHFPQDMYSTYYTEAIHTLQHARLDMQSRSPVHGYGELEAMGAWPILPAELTNSILDGDLFYLAELDINTKIDRSDY